MAEVGDDEHVQAIVDTDSDDENMAPRSREFGESIMMSDYNPQTGMTIRDSEADHFRDPSVFVGFEHAYRNGSITNAGKHEINPAEVDDIKAPRGSILVADHNPPSRSGSLIQYQTNDLVPTSMAIKAPASNVIPNRRTSIQTTVAAASNTNKRSSMEILFNRQNSSRSSTTLGRRGNASSPNPANKNSSSSAPAESGTPSPAVAATVPVGAQATGTPGSARRPSVFVDFDDAYDDKDSNASSGTSGLGNDPSGGSGAAARHQQQEIDPEQQEARRPSVFVDFDHAYGDDSPDPEYEEMQYMDRPLSAALGDDAEGEGGGDSSRDRDGDRDRRPSVLVEFDHAHGGSELDQEHMGQVYQRSSLKHSQSVVQPEVVVMRPLPPLPKNNNGDDSGGGDHNAKNNNNNDKNNNNENNDNNDDNNIYSSSSTAASQDGAPSTSSSTTSSSSSSKRQSSKLFQSKRAGAIAAMRRKSYTASLEAAAREEANTNTNANANIASSASSSASSEGQDAAANSDKNNAKNKKKKSVVVVRRGSYGEGYFDLEFEKIRRSKAARAGGDAYTCNSSDADGSSSGANSDGEETGSDFDYRDSIATEYIGGSGDGSSSSSSGGGSGGSSSSSAAEAEASLPYQYQTITAQELWQRLCTDPAQGVLLPVAHVFVLQAGTVVAAVVTVSVCSTLVVVLFLLNTLLALVGGKTAAAAGGGGGGGGVGANTEANAKKQD